MNIPLDIKATVENQAGAQMQRGCELLLRGKVWLLSIDQRWSWQLTYLFSLQLGSNRPKLYVPAVLELVDDRVALYFTNVREVLAEALVILFSETPIR